MSENKDKPKYIEARYNTYLTWDLEKEGIDWDKVEDWGISRTALIIYFKDGTEESYDQWSPSEVDYKHGMQEALVFNKDWEKVSNEGGD
tara:strand:+ start:218 stop:484 length:267 start_codon:yes stop_codon:yes gene_type:complete